MLTNEHCACRFANSVAPRVESENSVSVIGYAVPTTFWMWVTQARRFAVGFTFGNGSQSSGAATFNGAEMILIIPLFEITPVSGFEVRSFFTDKVRRPLWVSMHPQHSESCWSLSNT